jgi:aspartate kinase
MISVKFGGTSMGSAERIRGVAQIVIDLHKKQPAVTVSAMSGITDLLLKAAKAAITGQKREMDSILFQIQEKHLTTIDELVGQKSLRQKARDHIAAELTHLEEFLRAIAIIGELSPRSHDEIIALGEKFAAFMLSVHLEDQGFDAEYVSLENIVELGVFDKVDSLFFTTVQENIFSRITPILKRKGIPIITGFFGRIPGGIVEGIGRGYSDFTAALVGRALAAKEIQIWTDVDGILSADPRIVSETLILEELSFAEAAELAHFGAKVIHPQTIWPAVEKNIPVRIKNTMNPEAPGTLITKAGKHNTCAPFKSITAKKNITVVTLSNMTKGKHETMAEIFRLCSEHGVAIDLISTSEASLSLTVEGSEKKVTALEHQLKKFCTVSITIGMAVLAVVGEEMRENIGLSGRFFSTLGKVGVNIYMISQGQFEVNISCVILENDVEKAISALHTEFFSPCPLPQKS